MESYLCSLGYDVWVEVENGYVVPSQRPSTTDEKKSCDYNIKANNAIYCGLTNEILVKIMRYKSTKEV